MIRVSCSESIGLRSPVFERRYGAVPSRAGCGTPYGRVSPAAGRISPSFNLTTTGKTGIRFRRGGAGNRNFAARQRLTERCGRLGRIEAKRLFSFVPAPYGQGDAAKRARCSEYGIFNVTAFGITPEVPLCNTPQCHPNAPLP